MDQAIRTAIKSIIKAIYSTAQIYSFNALSHELTEWPGLFRTTDDKTHGWIIKRAAKSSTWKNPQRDRQQLDFDVWAFYKFTAGKDDDNSDSEFGIICDSVYAALKAKPTLDVAGVERHDLLQFLRFTTVQCGEETLHFAQGRLTVHLCC